ncbi:MAG: DUF2207 domain-containing protein [Clostridiales bacterium]|nr:DUF2207 domain-containing protein [Clostridiales bacterium]
MKKIISVMITLVITAALCVTAFGANEDVKSITSVDISAQLNADGTVSVEESWVVEFNTLPTGFSRSIDIYDGGVTNSVSLMQKYDEIRDISVTVNNTVVDDYVTSGLSSSGTSYDIEIGDLGLASQTVTYNISYVIEGAVKEIGDEGNFSFVFIGDSFVSTCNNVTITVITPESVGMDNISVDEEDSHFEEKTDNSATFSASRVGKTFAVSVSVPSSVFDDDSLASYSAFTEKFNSFKSGFLAALPWIIAVIAAVLVVIFVLFWDKIRRYKYEKETKQELRDEGEGEVHLLPEGISACVGYKMIAPYSKAKPKNTSKKVPYLFGMAVLECVEKGRILNCDEGLMIMEPKEDDPAYIQSVLKFLRTFSAQELGNYIVDSRFAEKVQRECETNYDNIGNYLTAFYHLIPTINNKFFKNNENIEKYEKVYAVKIAASEGKRKKNYNEYLSAVIEGARTDDPDIFAMMLVSSSGKFFEESGRDKMSAISDALGMMYKVYAKK